MIRQGDVWWADFPEWNGSTAAYARPAIVLQGDVFNRLALQTTICVPLTTNLELADLDGNVVVEPADTGLDRTSVAVLPLTQAIDRRALRERAGRVSADTVHDLLLALDVVLGR